VRALHGWEVSIARAREIQLSLVKRVVTENEVINRRFVVGIDIFSPHVLGLLSFPESLLFQPTCEKLGNIPDLILIDGQGMAHPRRFN
jgi:deoxyinosine 3'endonuclease (endonuclease V)